MLQNQYNTMEIVAFCFSATSKIQDASLVNKVEINNEMLSKVKISSLKIVKELGVIIEDEFRVGIKLILNL
jgi:hypothetical protein